MNSKGYNRFVMEKDSVAGMLTLYNSDRCVIDRISTYVDQVETLFIVDNSEFPDDALISLIREKYYNVKYINNAGNMGVANALNVAAESALKKKFNYLLMMDDDSEAPESLVKELISIADGPSVGIVSPQSGDGNIKQGVVEVLTTITSGSILKLDAYIQAGPFMDELFIDWVDHEYCFRLQKFGYKVMLANDVRLKHRLGVKKKRLVAGLIKITWRSHNPIRLYYKFRNSLFVLRLYRYQLPMRFTLFAYRELVEDFFKIVFLESDKSQYLKLVMRALTDLSQGRLGKLKQL